MSNSIHVTVAAIVENNGCYLLVEEESAGEIVINQPAGHVEPGESLIEAVVRETMEETGYRFMPEHLLGIYRWQSEEPVTYVRFVFIGSAEQTTGAVLDAEIQSVIWLDYQQINDQQDRLRSPLVLAAIDDHRSGTRFSLDCLKEPLSITL